MTGTEETNTINRAISLEELRLVIEVRKKRLALYRANRDNDFKRYYELYQMACSGAIFLYILYLFDLMKSNSEDENTPVIRETLYQEIKALNPRDRKWHSLPSLEDLECDYCSLDSTTRYLAIGAELGDLELVKAALKINPEINLDRPLCVAIKNNHEKVVKRLIELGADVNSTHTPLMNAICYSGNFELTQFLIEQGAFVDETIFYNALRKCTRPELIQSLYEKASLDINEPHTERVVGQFDGWENHESFLHCALQTMKKSRDGGVVRYLLGLPDLIKKEEDVIAAVAVGVEALSLFLNAGYTCTAKLCSAVIEKKECAAIDLVLKQKNADLEGAKLALKEKKKWSDLMFYAAINDIKQVTLLLENSDESLHTALIIATELGRKEMVSLLLQKGAKVNVYCSTHGDALFHACRNGDIDLITLLLNSQTEDCKIKKLTYNLAIQYAIREEQTEMVALLFAKKRIEMKHQTIELGLKSDHEDIRKITKLNAILPWIDNLKTELNRVTKRYKDNAGCLDLWGNGKKAAHITNAIKRADAAINQLAKSENPSRFICYMNSFLDYKEGNKKSIREELSHHRIGFFGKPRGQKTVEQFVEQRIGPMAAGS
ncbi:MAG: ankyrin repeat domain-containing protein [Tatlockia sp.]|jgi:ankyrin repeat protein